MVKELGIYNTFASVAKGNTFFVAHGRDGLSVYDWNSSNSRLYFRKIYSDIEVYEMSINGDMLILKTDNGLMQYNISDPENMYFVSRIF